MGQQRSLGIRAATMVSTEKFSRYAVRLALNENTPLRLLRPETSRNIKKWYTPDSIRMESPLVEIIKCSVLARTGDKIQEFQVDRERSSENNILVPTTKPNRYRVISLTKVFDVDVMQDPEHQVEFLDKVPTDGVFHKATVAYQYDSPRLYLKTKESLPNSGGDKGNIVPIGAIVFFVKVNSREKIAEAIVAETELEHQRRYISLVRHSCDDETCQLGGAFFR